MAMTDHIQETRRQAYLEWLYLRYRCTDGTYTGLYQRRIQELIQQDMDQAIGPLGDWS